MHFHKEFDPIVCSAWRGLVIPSMLEQKCGKRQTISRTQTILNDLSILSNLGHNNVVQIRYVA
jgi:hypothetical protein